ncbi:MAG: hypothetical protein WDN49_20220 [Acetobacteraceae bacterium]
MEAQHGFAIGDFLLERQPGRNRITAAGPTAADPATDDPTARNVAITVKINPTADFRWTARLVRAGHFSTLILSLLSANTPKA